MKSEVSSTLTKTYAEKMFDSIQDVSKGLADGSEGASMDYTTDQVNCMMVQVK